MHGDEIVSPRPLQAGTCRRLHHLTQKGLTHLTHLALPVTSGTFRRRCARLRA
ncbi:MAG: hypothetical protein MZV64_23605 [Ignavibacteriales bacterium]|nr:hypothetical protein [Ignavibacteriales bacterium]